MNETKLSKLFMGLIRIDNCLKNYKVYFTYGVVEKTLIVKVFRGDTLIQPFKLYNISLGDEFEEHANICMIELEMMVTGEMNK